MSRSHPLLDDSRPPLESSPPAELPRLLRALPEHGAMSLDEHLDVHGPPPASANGGSPRAIVEEIERAGLRGRGGAAFPTALKIGAVAERRRRRVVVVNSTEGEPASYKDRTLAYAAPHLILDGAVLAARAVKAEGVLVAVCESDREGRASLARAIAERASSVEREAHVKLVSVPAGYVRGEESAVIDHLGGGAGLPTFSPPPSERGVRGRPTLSSNAETFAHIALIARHGASWFRQLGSPSEPGSALVTLIGPVAEPGVFEIEIGTSLGSLIAAAGGQTGPAQAVLIGGYGGSWVRPERLSELPLSDEGLRPYGASLGAGVVALLDDDACAVAETSRLLRWLADESTGQCGPCLHGLDAIATEFNRITSGVGADEHAQRLQRLTAIVNRRGACAHPDGAVRLARSALRSFTDALLDHATHGACEGCLARPRLPLPEPRA